MADEKNGQEKLPIPPDPTELLTKIQNIETENATLKAQAKEAEALKSQLAELTKKNKEVEDVINQSKADKDKKEIEEAKAKNDFTKLFEKMEESQKVLLAQLNEKNSALTNTATELKTNQDKLKVIQDERDANILRMRTEIKAIADKKGDKTAEIIANNLDSVTALEIFYNTFTKATAPITDKSRSQFEAPPDGLMTSDDFSVADLIKMKTENTELYNKHLENIGNSGILNTGRARLR